MTSLQLYLKDGKWFGNEFPEEPIPYGVGDEQYYGARMDKYNAAVEKAKSEALEVSNPEVVFVYDAHIWFFKDREKDGLRKATFAGVLYPWEGEWEIVKQTGSDGSWWDDCTDEGYELTAIGFRRQVLRLLPKSPVTDPCREGEADSPSNEESYHVKSPVIPEGSKGAGDDCPIFIDGDFNDSYEARVRRSKGKGPSPIPVSDAESIAKNRGYNQVIIIARKIGEGGIEHVTTYGTDKANCSAAAQIGDFLKHQVMGWAKSKTIDHGK